MDPARLFVSAAFVPGDRVRNRLTALLDVGMLEVGTPRWSRGSRSTLDPRTGCIVTLAMAR